MTTTEPDAVEAIEQFRQHEAWATHVEDRVTELRHAAVRRAMHHISHGDRIGAYQVLHDSVFYQQAPLYGIHVQEVTS